MKCRWCSKEAVIYLRSYGLGLCEEDFIRFFLRRISESIKRYNMFSKDEKILVAVSGGKDSLVIWDALLKLGYNAQGLFINLGISPEETSNSAQKVVEEFAKKQGAALNIVNLKREYGFSIDEVKRKETRTVCAACGMVKRYVMNKFAYEMGFDVLVTGHNLNDETATLLSNTLSWKVGYLARQSPVLPAKGKLVKKAKPLCELTERETTAYAIILNLKFFDSPCPYSKGATSKVYKKALNMIEYNSPGTKLRFYREFLKQVRSMFEEHLEELQLKDCPVCGYPTTYPPCAFCRLRNRMVS